MATANDWNEKLRKCNVFYQLKSVQGEILLNSYTNWLENRESFVFVYNEKDCSILCFNVNSNDNSSFLTLALTNPPLCEVNEIKFSPQGFYLALIGDNHVTIVELQEKWPAIRKYDMNTKLLCKSYAVAERLFKTSDVSILCFEWHTGSKHDEYLLLLTSDEYLRIYCHRDALEPVQQLCFQQQQPVLATSVSRQLSTELRSTQLSTDIHKALGETAVSMCMGSPVVAVRRKKPNFLNQSQQSQSDSGEDVMVWPIYILWGNGEVYVVHSSTDKVHWPLTLEGPLSMYPAAEDNYGSEACSILHIPSQPPCLAIGTSEGKIYHCVILPSQHADDNNDSVSLNGSVVGSSVSVHSSILSPRNGSDMLTSCDDQRLFRWPTLSNLYVFERLDLEFSLNVDDGASANADMASYPLHFHADPLTPYRYHCSHSCGVHSVVLTWLQKLEQFAAADEDADGGSSPRKSSGFRGDTSTINHVVCTTPLRDSQSSPLLGLCVVSDRQLGAALLCLNSSFQCLAVPLMKSASLLPAPLLVSQLPLRDDTATPRSQREPFEEVIKRLLRKKCSQPLLLSRQRNEPSAKDVYELLVRATGVLRSEYFEKLSAARTEMDKRLHVLKEQLKLQTQCAEQNKQLQADLSLSEFELYQKLDDVVAKQEMLNQRLRLAMRQLQAALPQSTRAEADMYHELDLMNKNIKELETRVRRLKMKQEYDESYRTQVVTPDKRSNFGSPRSPRSPRPPISGISERQQQHLRSLLDNEQSHLTELMQRVNHLRLVVDL